MVKTLIVKPLGLVLQKAGLISHAQLTTALKDQSQLSSLKIGEILAVKGWIKLETANFFAEQWPKLLEHFQDRPLGQHLKAAALLSEYQIRDILQEQQQTGLQFGSIAVSNGSVAQSTVDFFLEQLDLIQGIYAQLQGTNNINKIENYILKNQKCAPVDLLKLYQQIWQEREIASNGTEIEEELVNSGLINLSEGKLSLNRPIYHSIFNQNWIERKLSIWQSSSKSRLKMFGIETKASSPQQVLQEVSTWTGNQPILNQKVYQIIRGSDFFIAEGQEARFIGKLVQTYMIDDWRHKSLAQHLQEVSSRLLENRQCFPLDLLQVYEKIWIRGELEADNSAEQAELLNIGLIRREDNQVKIANRIYYSIFNQSWIEEQLVFSAEKTRREREKVETIAEEPIKEHRYRKIWAIILIWLILIGSMAVGINFWLNNREKKVFQLATRMLQKREYEAALFTYDQVLEINRLNYKAWHNRGYALAGLKQYQQMFESCASATKIEPEAKDSWSCQGEALYNLSKYQEALTAFQEAVALDAQEPIFWLNIAESLLKLKQYQLAATASDNAIALLEKTNSDSTNLNRNQDLATAWENKGEALLQQQRYYPALDSFKQALNYNQNDLSAQWGKARVLQELGFSSEALRELDLVLKRNDLSSSQEAVTWFYQGLNFCELGEIALGVEALEQAIILNPDDPKTKKALEKCMKTQ